MKKKQVFTDYNSKVILLIMEKNPHKNKGLYDFFSRMKIFRKLTKKIFYFDNLFNVINIINKVWKSKFKFKNILMGFVSVLLVMSTGYMVHYFHTVYVLKLYNDKC